MENESMKSKFLSYLADIREETTLVNLVEAGIAEKKEKEKLERLAKENIKSFQEIFSVIERFDELNNTDIDF